MLKTYTHEGCHAQSPADPAASKLDGDVVWIDLLKPLPEETGFVSRATGLTLPTLGELSEVESSSRMREADGTLFFSVPMVFRSPRGEPRTTPIGLILSPERLITIRYQPFRSFDEFCQRMQQRDQTPMSAIGVFVALLEAIIDRLADMLEECGANLDSVSESIFADRGIHESHTPPAAAGRKLRAVLRRVGQDRQMISKIRATLLGIDRIVPFCESHCTEWPGTDIKQRLEVLRRDVTSLDEYETHLSDKVQFLLDAALGFINVQQNDTFRILTIVSVVGIPPTLVASMYGMNFKGMPELDWPHGYAYGLSMILLSAVAPLIYFKVKGWF